MNFQRWSLFACGFLAVAGSVGSRIYFKSVGGYIAPFLAPALFSSLRMELTGHAIFWFVVFVVGLAAWWRSRPAFTYSFVASVVALLIVGEYAAWLLARL